MGDNDTMDSGRTRGRKPARLHVVGDGEPRRAEAKLRTTHALEELDPSVWTVIEDLQWPGGRHGHVGHVVVGRSGVYVIETKAWGRDASVYGGRLRYQGATQDAVVAALTESAAAVALLTPGVPPQLVKPVLCVAGAQDLSAQVDGLLVCSADSLVSVLESRVHGMSSHQITIASGQLRDHLHDRGLVKVATRAGHREAKQANRGASRPMRGVPVIRIAIAVWFAATLILAPHVFTDAFDTIHDTFEEQVSNR